MTFSASTSFATSLAQILKTFHFSYKIKVHVILKIEWRLACFQGTLWFWILIWTLSTHEWSLKETFKRWKIYSMLVFQVSKNIFFFWKQNLYSWTVLLLFMYAWSFRFNFYSDQVLKHTYVSETQIIFFWKFKIIKRKARGNERELE